MASQVLKAFQTADDKNYAHMLSITAECNSRYFKAIDVEFETFVGLKRGYFPWHACFNRIMYLKEQMDAGYDGWIFYLDADAFVYDHQFDINGLISEATGDVIFAPGGLTGHQWDVNDGVFLINLGSKQARRLAQAWYDSFMATTEEQLQGASDWQMVPSDQPRLHRILQDNPDILERVQIVPRELLNDEKASFVRQILRANAETFDQRVENIRRQVNDVLIRIGAKPRLDTHMTIGGKTTSSVQYGQDYATEFKRVLATYASNAQTFLEWGAGYTTRMTVDHIGDRDCGLFLTIDENANYLSEVLNEHSEVPYLQGKALSVTGPCVNDRDPEFNYATYPLSRRTKFDFIFIDGRRRMECAFMAALMVKPTSIIVIHDYRRSRYQPIKALFRIVEDGPQFRVMAPRASIFDQIDEVSPLVVETMMVKDREQF